MFNYENKPTLHYFMKHCALYSYSDGATILLCALF